jgi:4-hydroxybenzoate polyprenyltransferase
MRHMETDLITKLAGVSRPWFWPVSAVPTYLGTVVAGGTWLPADTAAAALALLVISPLTWGAVLAQNDLHDLPSDSRNPRKATAPLVTGAISAERLARWYQLLALGALIAGVLIGGLYALGVATVLALGWAYSAPPLRLKTRPGADVAVNALVVGVLAPLGGWSISRSPDGFPWQMGLLGLLFTAALYLPSTVTDWAADRAAGDTTFAVRYGRRRTYRLGVALWAAALATSVLCATLDTFVPRTTRPYQLALVPVLLAAYAWLTRRPSIPRLACLAALFGVPTLGFLLAITG